MDLLVVVIVAGGCAPGDADDAPGDSGSSEGSSEASTGAEPVDACAMHGWDDALAAWEAALAMSGPTYWYSQRSGGNDAEVQDCSYLTTIEITGESVTRRHFEITGLGEVETEDECMYAAFDEDAATLGTHGGAAAPYTMAELYAGCCDLLALEPADEYSFGFGVDAAGLVDFCYAVPLGCADDCSASVDGFGDFNIEAYGFGAPP